VTPTVGEEEKLTSRKEKGKSNPVKEERFTGKGSRVEPLERKSEEREAETDPAREVPEKIR